MADGAEQAHPGGADPDHPLGPAAISVAQLLDAVGEGIYGLDREGRTTFVNPAAERMLGYSRAELIGALQHEVIHHKRADGSPYEAAECPIYASIRDGSVDTVDDEVFWRKDGSSFPVEYTTTPIYADGAVVGGVVTFRDVSERRRAMDEVVRSRALLARAQAIGNQGSWEWTVADNRVVWSDQLYRIYGLAPGEFGGTVEAFLARLLPEDRERIQGRIEQAIRTGEPFRFEERIVRPDGSVRVLDSQGEVQYDAAGSPVRLTGICRDVTEERAAERRVHELIREQAVRAEAEVAGARIRRILESITDGFMAIDREWRVVHANEPAARLAGITPAELIGSNLWDRFPEARHSEFYGPLVQALSENEPVEFVAYYPPLDGWFAVRAYPSDDGLAVYARDVTAEKEREAALRESESRFRFMTDAIPQQVWTSTKEGALSYVNAQVVEYFGRPAEEVVGDGWQTVIHPDDLPWVLDRWTEALSTGEGYEVEFRLLRHDGRYRWHLARAQAQRGEDGAIRQWFGTNTDFHDLKAAEEERDRALDELKRSNQELDRFAYVASHDLKAPLRGIASLASWIGSDLGDEIPEETAEHLALLQTRVHRLESLIDGLLQYSRAGRAKTSVELVDSRALVEEVIDLLAPGDHVEIALEGRWEPMRTERALLQQVFLNLLSNALKYHDKDRPRIRVVADPSPPDGFHAFSVIDDGPGIAPRYHDRVWEIFQTLQPRDRVESTGIGLAVVKKIVLAKGGAIELESAEGAGATFRFLWKRNEDGGDGRR